MTTQVMMGRMGLCVAVVVGIILAAGPQALGDINAVVQTVGVPGAYVSFPWRAGSLAVGDFNGDGQIDAAAAGTYIAGVAIVFGGGSQTWVSTTAWPIALAAGDFNGDGLVDLAVAEQDSGGVSILTSSAGGGLTRTGFCAAGEGATGCSAVVAADLNKDGLVDLVVANRAANTVAVLRNTGSGFVLQQTLAVGSEPSALCVADLNNDSWVDVAVACAGDDSVQVLKNSLGVLSIAGTFEGGAYPEGIAAADLDGDGTMDLAVADHEAPQVTVLLNQGGWQFAGKAVSLSDPTKAFEPAMDVQLIDMNLDGRVDIRCNGMVLLNRGGADFVVCNNGVSYGMVYAQGFVLADPTVFVGTASRGSGSSNAVAVSHPVMGPIRGDITADRHVDVMDLLALAGNWGKTAGATGFNAACDLNGDGSTDVVDLLILADVWGV